MSFKDGSVAVKVHDNRSLFDVGEVVKADTSKSVLLILNNPRGISKRLIAYLWKVTGMHVCADGGSNWLFDEFDGSYIPSIVHGDLDSIRPEVSEFFKKKGVTVTRDRNEDTTDMSKCLAKIKALPNSNELSVFVAGIFGSRFDHEMGNLNSAFTEADSFSRLILLSNETYGEILMPGVQHRIFPNRVYEGPICGLIPLFGECREVHTAGLRWNIEGRSTTFGGLVSTSNEIAAASVSVVSTEPLLWTTTLETSHLTEE